MKPTNPFNSETRAVSPVIGVILMVAITVILAAVIGTFVLGLGDSLGDNQPTAQISADISNDSVVIEHNGGDSIDSESLRVVIETASGDNSAEATSKFTDRFSVGDSYTGTLQDGGTDEEIDPDVRVRVIHTPSDSVLLDRTTEVSGAVDFDSVSFDDN